MIGWHRVERVAWVVAIAVLAVVGYGLIWLPYYGDHALFAMIGRDVLDGRVLYRETWDLKQPGIFLWYGAVDAVFGPAPVVTRTLDVLVAALTAVLVGALVRDRVGPTLARWVPVAAAAALLLPARSFDLGQIEQLACLPMVGALVLLTRRPGPARTVLAGLCIGLVAVLKLWTAMVPAAAAVVWLIAGGLAADSPHRAGRSVVLTRIGLLAAGAAVPVVAVLVWLGLAGALGDAMETWLVFPQELLAVPGARTPERLVGGVARYAALLAPALLLAAACLPGVLRRRDPLGSALLAWLVVGLAEILVQLWWPYHWTLLTPALVALGALGLSGLRRTGRLRRSVVIAVLLASTLPLVYAATRPEQPVRLGNGFTAASRAEIADLGTVGTAQAELAAVGYRRGESLMVLGDPTYQLVAGTSSPARLNGWSPELYTPAQWAELGTDLAAHRPDLVLVTDLDVELVPQRGPAVAELLATAYRPIRSTDVGDWYRLRDGDR